MSSHKFFLPINGKILNRKKNYNYLGNFTLIKYNVVYFFFFNDAFLILYLLVYLYIYIYIYIQSMTQKKQTTS